MSNKVYLVVYTAETINGTVDGSMVVEIKQLWITNIEEANAFLEQIEKVIRETSTKEMGTIVVKNIINLTSLLK